MMQQCRETVQKAIGMVEGIAWISDDNLKDALFCVAEMLDGVLTEEWKNDEKAET